MLLLLNLLLSRIVLAPVRRVHDAMARAATGDLQVRLPVHSRDEVGQHGRVVQPHGGRARGEPPQVEGYSRNLESMVEARTGELRASQASLLALKNHLATVIANVGTGVLSLDEEGRIETFNERAGEILGLAPEGARGRTLEEALGAATTARLVEAVAVVRDGREESARGPDRVRAAAGPPHALRRGLGAPRRGPAAHRHRGRGRGPHQILATQRLEAWKEAVERVIHEIKNPLTPVGLAAETLKTAWARDPARFADRLPLGDRHDPGGGARPQGADRRVLALLAAAADAAGAARPERAGARRALALHAGRRPSGSR